MRKIIIDERTPELGNLRVARFLIYEQDDVWWLTTRFLGV